MRLDFALYGITIVLFALAAIVFVLNPNGRDVYTIAISILGILTAATGYVLRPRTETTTQAQPTTPPQAAPEQTQPQPVVAAPTVEPPKTETPTPQVETPPTTPPPPQPPETPAASPTVETPKPPEPAPAPEAPVLTAPPPAPQLSAPTEVPVLSATAPPVASDLTQIHGINAKRAEQLKAIGINSVADLSKASPEETAAKLQVSPKIVKMWIGSAKKQTK